MFTIQKEEKLITKKKDIYKEIWNEALKSYIAHEARSGHALTFFSYLQHKFQLYPVLLQFQKDLDGSASIADSKSILVKWMSDKRLKQNHYSFKSYLLDRLQIAFPGDWEIYARDQYVFYTGIVYHGTSSFSPDYVFKNGLHSNGSNNVSSYADISGSITGVSTTKNPTIAKKYSHIIYSRGIVPNIHNLEIGYVYEIHLRDLQGIDLPGMYHKFYTEKKYESLEVLMNSKQEVNVIGAIKSEDIIGHGYVIKGKYKEIKRNPHYNQDKKNETAEQPMPIILKRLFP